MSNYANGWHTEERTYGPDGTLIAYIVDGKIIDTRDIAPTEQDLMVQRLNEGLAGRGMSQRDELLNIIHDAFYPDMDAAENIRDAWPAGITIAADAILGRWRLTDR